MELILTSAGSYPRIGETPDTQRHRRAYAQHERGEISGTEWRAVEDEVAEHVVQEQTAIGLDVVTDGLVRWYDPISHLARHCEGIQINGLLRYFDTNFYFRQPVVSGRIRRREPVLRREFEVARAATDRVVKPVLTGPYSLACGSILEGGYRTRRELTHAYAEVLAQEVADLVHAGAAVIQVDEPYLLRHPEDADLVREGIATLAAARGRAHLALYTFFGDALPLWDDLMAMPVDLVGLDLTYGPKLADRIAEAGAPRTLVLGVVDGRNTKLESRDALLRSPRPRVAGTSGSGGPRPVLRAGAPAASPGPGKAREHGRDRARARGTRREAPMSRAKLERLGLDLPVLPTSTVGSFPKPDYLVEARAKATRNAITRPELDRLERQATEFWVRTQEELGLDVLVDGEQYRGDMVAYFAETMPGFARGGLVRSYGNRYYHKPVMVGPVRWPGPMTVDWWRWTQSLTTRPVKGMLTGPYTLMDWSFDDHYPDRKAACLALAVEVRKEVEALLEAGVRIIQIDEPALSVRPDELGFAVEAMHLVVDGLPAYYVVHACFGAFETIYPGLLDLPVDNLDLAISHSALDLLGMFEKDPFTKDLSLGVLDVHTHSVEAGADVQARIRRGTTVLPADRIWVDPDCGLKTRTVEESRAKLAVMMSAVRAARAELG